MVDKSVQFKQKLKQKGMFNFSELYNFCFDWLKDNGYGIKELEYIEKNSATGKEINIKWEAGKKVTDYFKNVISVKWKILGMTDVEAEQNGQKIKTNKGEVGLEIEGVLYKDHEDGWEKQPFWKFMRGVYDKYVIRTTTEHYEDGVKDDAIELTSQIKSFLQLGK